jgi:iron complex transport system substrate-binding protein
MLPFNVTSRSTYNRTTLANDYTPRRVVSLQPSATVTLRDLGLLDRLVACTKYCADVCPEVGNGSRLIISDSWSAQAEQIIAAKPDLVIASVPYQLESVAEILKAGVRFLGLAPRTLEDIYRDIATIAGAFNVSQQAQGIIARMRDAIEQVRSYTVTTDRSPLVFCEEWGKPLIASQCWVAELIEAAGGRFLGEPGTTTSFEVVADAQPEILLAAWCGAGDRVPLEKIIEQRNWKDLPAARDCGVFCISDELLNTPASNLIDGLHAIAWAVHPEMFPKPRGIRRIGEAPSYQPPAPS